MTDVPGSSQSAVTGTGPAGPRGRPPVPLRVHTAASGPRPRPARTRRAKALTRSTNIAWSRGYGLRHSRMGSMSGGCRAVGKRRTDASEWGGGCRLAATLLAEWGDFRQRATIPEPLRRSFPAGSILQHPLTASRPAGVNHMNV